MLAVQNSSVRAMMMPRSMNGCGSESTTYPSIVRKSSRKSSTKKSVRFAATVKVHDGLSPHKRVYDEVVHDLFNRPDDRYRTIRDVVNSANVPILELLKAQLDELMRRCSQGKTPVLNCGSVSLLGCANSQTKSCRTLS